MYTYERVIFYFSDCNCHTEKKQLLICLLQGFLENALQSGYFFWPALSFLIAYCSVDYFRLAFFVCSPSFVIDRETFTWFIWKWEFILNFVLNFRLSFHIHGLPNTIYKPFYFSCIIRINMKWHRMPGIAIMQCNRTDYQASYID